MTKDICVTGKVSCQYICSHSGVSLSATSVTGMDLKKITLNLTFVIKLDQLFAALY